VYNETDILKIASDFNISKEELINELDASGLHIKYGQKNISRETGFKIYNILMENRKKVVNHKIIKTDIEMNSINRMEYYIKNFKIFLDTSSLLDDEIYLFIDNIVPLLKTNNKKILVIPQVGMELEKHANRSNDEKLKEKSKKIILILNKLIKQNLIEVIGGTNESFADNVFLSVFTKFRIDHNLLLITEDKKLANDIENLSNITSVKTNKVINVRKINRYGFLSKHNLNKTTDIYDSKIKSIRTNNENKKIIQHEAFKLFTKVSESTNKPLSISILPKVGDTLLNEKGEKIKLINEIASGGEGIIYETDSKYIAKIYKKDQLNTRKFEKIKKMISIKIDNVSICYPREILYTTNQEFVGYLMPKAKGKELQKSLFINQLLKKNFPYWNRKNSVELCLTILEKIKYLHERNIILGDINPMNILVVSSKEVYFVDTDSYQIEGYPCPVGTINFTAPEIQRKSFNEFLRTFQNEYFAVSTLLFMIMLPGKPPYSQQGGESPIDNIIKMDFSYRLGDKTNHKTPIGQWRYMWSHLPYFVKESFYNTFHYEGSNSKPQNRINVIKWISIFKRYEKLILDGTLINQDEMALDVFPKRVKKISKFNYEKCSICKVEHKDSQMRKGICNECLSKGEHYSCKKCGKHMIYTNNQKFLQNKPKFETCFECFDGKEKMYQILSCTICYSTFNIPYNEYKKLKKNNLPIPRECKKCKSNNTTKAKKNNINKQPYNVLSIGNAFSNLINNFYKK